MTNRIRLSLAALAATVSSSAGAWLFGCNAVLGIEKASLAPDASTDGSPGAPDGSDPCALYCSLVNANCTGPNREYLATSGTVDVCMTICPYLAHPAGDSYQFPGPTPPSVDTLGCRIWHARTAGTEHPETHCRHAGPLGADACGNNPCKAFCNFDLNYCFEHSTPPVSVYAGDPAYCEAVCAGDAGFPYIQGASGDLVDQNGAQIEFGNTLNCRLWHLETAIQLAAPVPHCAHSDEDGGGKCVGPPP